MKVISFKLWGKFAHFRKFWTTTSSLSYPFPPPTALRGILGAILGYSKAEYIEKTKPFKVGVEILAPVRSIKLSINFLDTKKLGTTYDRLKKNISKSGLLHTQPLVEILRDPIYRVFVGAENIQLLEKLENTIKRKENVYSVSLGWANFLANLEFENSCECLLKKEVFVARGIIPVSQIENLEFEKDNFVGREKIPVELSKERKPLKYESVVFSLSVKPLRGKFKNLYYCDKWKGIYLF